VHLEGVEEMTSKDRFPSHETICGQCGTTIYKPFKELSGDEITFLWHQSMNLAISDDNLKNNISHATIFARAILKKASEK
jgi:hypothetical protein